jgi:hypothetical protein
MIVLAFIAFVIGVACAFTANLLIFAVVAFALTVVSALLSLQFDLDAGASLAALIGAVAVQVGYAAGVLIRSVIFPFSGGVRRGCARRRPLPSEAAGTPRSG